jgi:hypothetical protein
MAQNDPKARKVTISYSGGTARGPLGLIEYLFGEQTLEWPTQVVGGGPGGRRRFAYGTRKKTAAAAGEQAFLDLETGETVSLRYTGAFIDFVQYVVRATGNAVVQVYTRRGTEIGRRPTETE